jgi:hypothetical protein
VVRIDVDEDLRRIAFEIVGADRSVEDWAETESDDSIQVGAYTGGFDATEMAFCFSRHGASGSELWCQFGLAHARDIADGTRTSVDGRLPQ